MSVASCSESVKSTFVCSTSTTGDAMILEHIREILKRSNLVPNNTTQGTLRAVIERRYPGKVENIIVEFLQTSGPINGFSVTFSHSVSVKKLTDMVLTRSMVLDGLEVFFDQETSTITVQFLGSCFTSITQELVLRLIRFLSAKNSVYSI